MFNTVPDAEARIRFTTDGILERDIDGIAVNTLQYSGQWWTSWSEPGIGNDYEVRMATYSDNGAAGITVGGSPTGNWVSLSTTRMWSFNLSLFRAYQADVTFEIRDTATQTLQDTLTAQILLEVGV